MPTGCLHDSCHQFEEASLSDCCANPLEEIPIAGVFSTTRDVTDIAGLFSWQHPRQKRVENPVIMERSQANTTFGFAQY
jgi:hypothetical protein